LILLIIIIFTKVQPHTTNDRASDVRKEKGPCSSTTTTAAAGGGGFSSAFV